MSNPQIRHTQQSPLEPCCHYNGREVRDSEDHPILHLHQHRGMEAGVAVGKSRCFVDIRFWVDPEEREDGIWDLVQHMRGDRHASLCWNTNRDRGRGYGEYVTTICDPVAGSIKKIAVTDATYEPLNEDEAKQFEQILRDAYHGRLEAVEASFEQIRQLREPDLDPLQPIGNIAAVMGHLPIVQFVLEKEAPLDRLLALAIQKGAPKSAEMNEFYQKDFDRLNDLIQGPKRTPNVPDEVTEEIDRLVPR